MSNKTNKRRSANKRNKHRRELPIAHGCGGEGHNGQKGRSKWKKLSRRSERRAAGVRVPKIKKYVKRRHKTLVPRPTIFDAELFEPESTEGASN
jgi:hypothetical protein